MACTWHVRLHGFDRNFQTWHIKHVSKAIEGKSATPVMSTCAWHSISKQCSMICPHTLQSRALKDHVTLVPNTC